MADYTYTAATAWPVTLSEVKSHLNVTHATDDEYLEGLIKAATNTLEARSRRCFITQTRKLELDGFADTRYVHRRKIYPDRSPIKNSSGVSITYVNASGTTTTLPSSDYVVSFRERPGHIDEAYNATWPDARVQPNSVVVTYVAGHSTVASGVPYHVKLAVQQLVAHWYLNREPVITGTITRELELMIDALMEAEHIESYG